MTFLLRTEIVLQWHKNIKISFDPCKASGWHCEPDPVLKHWERHFIKTHMSLPPAVPLSSFDGMSKMNVLVNLRVGDTDRVRGTVGWGGLEE